MEGAQSWFDNNRESAAIYNDINTCAELKEHDPGLAALCWKVLVDRSAKL